MKKILCCIFLLINFAAGACEKHDKLAKNIHIKDVWARQSFGQSKNSAIYMTIENTGDMDYIIAAHTEIANMCELHKTVIEQGISQMVHINRLALPKGVKVKLKPKGLHVMVMGLKKSLKPGDNFKITLTFEKAGKITLNVPVKKMRD